MRDLVYHDPFADHVISVNYERFIAEDRAFYQSQDSSILEQLREESRVNQFRRTDTVRDLRRLHQSRQINAQGQAGGNMMSSLRQSFRQQILKSMRLKTAESCTICMVDYEVNCQISILNCKGQHMLHPECLEGWLAQCKGKRLKLTCPMCRSEIDEK